jgi:UDP-N-acetylmuramoylalanine-D-glutamate ligase
MVELVTESQKLADAGECILFSPATSVSDMFESYIERGEEFSRTVRQINDRKTA